jgi:two-component system response regulator LytT
MCIRDRRYADNSTMSEYESRLDGQGFYRIHKTCLVQLKYIQDIFPWNNSSFALRVKGSTTPLPIGRDRVKELRRRLNI